MSVSKVIFGTETLIDITDTTAIAEDVAEGKTFLSASGVLTTGTNQGGGGTPEAHTITIDSLGKIGPSGYKTDLPIAFYEGCAVVYNDEIHILRNRNHYKWDGTSWTSVSTLPYIFNRGQAIVYNNEIHIVGCSINKYHYKWDGTSWTQVSTLPYVFYDSGLVIYNGEIHILGGYATEQDGNYHYKWDGTSWVSVSTLPFSLYRGEAVVYNNEIHILGGYNGNRKHYKWNGTSWTSVSTLPYIFYDGEAVVYNDEIHIFGGYNTNTDKNHYKWDGTSWTQVNDLPYDFCKASAVLYHGLIHLLGSEVTSTEDCRYKHYAFLPYITTPTSITSNGIYNIVGSKTETALDKLISNLTAKTGTTIDVNIDMSATATADKIMQGYTAWVNNVKLTGTASGGGGGGYLQTGKASTTSTLTFSNLSIPYSSISTYMMRCSSLSTTSTHNWVFSVTNVSGSKYASSCTFPLSGANFTINNATSYITVSGSGNSITFTSSSSSYARFTTTSNAYTIMYC